MYHRHLDIEEGQWGVAVIDSIWERGSDADVLTLMREVRRDPKGPAAEAVRRAIPGSKVYGYPKLFKLLLEKLDATPACTSIGDTNGKHGWQDRASE